MVKVRAAAIRIKLRSLNLLILISLSNSLVKNKKENTVNGACGQVDLFSRKISYEEAPENGSARDIGPNEAWLSYISKT